MSLGARPSAVMKMVLQEVLWLNLAGIALAAPLWAAGAPVLSANLFGVNPVDLPSLVAGVTLLSIVGGFRPFAHRVSIRFRPYGTSSIAGANRHTRPLRVM